MDNNNSEAQKTYSWCLHFRIIVRKPGYKQEPEAIILLTID